MPTGRRPRSSVLGTRPTASSTRSQRTAVLPVDTDRDLVARAHRADVTRAPSLNSMPCFSKMRSASRAISASIPGRDALEVLEHGDARAQAAPHRAELEADVAGADHDQVLGHLGIAERLGARADAIAVELHAAQRRDLAAGRDDDVLGLDLDVVGAAADGDATGADDAAVAVVARDLVLLEQAGDALREPADDAVFALEHARQVELDAADLDAEVGQLRDRLGGSARSPRAAPCSGCNRRAGTCRRAPPPRRCRPCSARAARRGWPRRNRPGLRRSRSRSCWFAKFQTSSNMREGASTHCLMRFRNVTASRPSTRR